MSAGAKPNAEEREAIVENVYNPFIYTCMKLHSQFRELKIENPDDQTIAEIFKRYDDLLAFLQNKREQLRKQVRNAGTPRKVRISSDGAGRTLISLEDGITPVPGAEIPAGSGDHSGPSVAGALSTGGGGGEDHDLHRGLHLPGERGDGDGGREGGGDAALPDQEEVDEGVV